MDNLNIKELIQAVRKELIESQKEREAKNEEALFVVDSLKIEVNFVVQQREGGKGGVDLKVVQFGTSNEYIKEQVHKITLEMKTAPIINDAIRNTPYKKSKGSTNDNKDLMVRISPIVQAKLGVLPKGIHPKGIHPKGVHPYVRYDRLINIEKTNKDK